MPLILVLATPLAAQDPPVRPDTVPATPDSAAADTLDQETDSVYPLPQLAAFGADTADGGWAAGEWIWDRDALMATGAFTLADLLQRVPGVTAVRSGDYGLPRIATAFGATGGRIELLLDGFAIDPLGAAAVDLSYIALNALERVRVERRPGRLRIELRTIEPADSRPYSVIEAGRGDRLNVDLFRGLFLAPNVLHGRLSLGVERLKSAGFRRAESASEFTGWVKYGIVRGDSSGIQLEYRRGRVTRAAPPYPGEGVRTDWVVRGRARPLADLTAEAFAGVSSLERSTVDFVPPDEGPLVETVPATFRSRQAGLRARYDAGAYWAGTTLRLRDHEALPGFEAGFEAGAELPGAIRVDGAVRAATWEDGDPTTSVELRSRWRPWRGLEAFADYATGAVGVPFAHARVDLPLVPDTAGAPAIDDRTAARAGVRFDAYGLSLGAAALALDVDSVRSFGLPFEGTARTLPGGSVRGFEVDVVLPLFWEPLSFEASHTEWVRGDPWIYLPEQSTSAAVAYHDLPLESGNLELFARIEGRRRGAMLVPAVDGTGTAAVPATTLFDFYLQIRVVSVRAFMRWENIFHRFDLYDVPDRNFPGQRILYGIKWEFWN